MRFYLLSAALVLSTVFGFWYLTMPHMDIVEMSVGEFVVLTKTYEETLWVPELPVRLVIPRLGIDAAVQYVGLVPGADGEMAVPDNFTDVGWYKEGVRPGMKGSAVMAGHYNGKGVAEAVFFDLHELELGDEVVIMSANRIEDIFMVVRVETYDYNASTEEIFEVGTEKAKLNLITCGGEWLPQEKLFKKRTVVFTEQLTDVE